MRTLIKQADETMQKAYNSSLLLKERCIFFFNTEYMSVFEPEKKDGVMEDDFNESGCERKLAETEKERTALLWNVCFCCSSSSSTTSHLLPFVGGPFVLATSQ